MTSTALVPANLSDLPTARLPAVYEAASRAIAECERIDECKTWSDKMAALASYARQAKDDSLRVMAVRIQLRAERRGGELLKQIEPSKGGRPTHDGAGISRSNVAAAAGLSERQKVTALRIASVPEPEFNRQVESATPPTVTRLAEQGKATRASAAVSAHTLATYFKGCEALTQFSRFCDRNDPVELARAVDISDIEALSGLVLEVRQWLDRFAIHLPEGGMNPC